MTRPGWARPSPNPRPPEGPRTPMRGEIAEPHREIVEIHDEDGAPTLYIVEPSTASRAELDGVPHALADLDDVELPPGAVGVLTRTEPSGPVTARPVAHHHEQPVAATFWLMAHGLAFTPNVSVTGTAGQHIWPASITHSPGQTVATFAYPVAGTADLS